MTKVPANLIVTIAAFTLTMILMFAVPVILPTKEIPDTSPVVKEYEGVRTTELLETMVIVSPPMEIPGTGMSCAIFVHKNNPDRAYQGRTLFPTSFGIKEGDEVEVMIADLSHPRPGLGSNTYLVSKKSSDKMVP